MLLYDPSASVFEFDGNRMELAEEFRDNQRGPYSFELQRILDRMRTTPLKGRYVLLIVEPFRVWQLARLSGERCVAPALEEGVRYTSAAMAEWDIFKRRWKDLTGVTVTVSDPVL